MSIQTTPRKWWLFALAVVLLSCGDPNDEQSNSRVQDVASNAGLDGQSVSTENLERPSSPKVSSRTTADPPEPLSGMQGAVPSVTSATVVDPDPPNATLPTIPSPPSTVAPPYIPFICSVVARDYSGSAPQGRQALEVLVQTQGPTSGGVWAEATSRNFRKRIALKLETNGTGRTVLLAPDGYDVQIKIFAASTFEPLSLMCATSP